MQKDRDKNNPAQRRRNQKPRSNRNPIKKCVNQQPNYNRISLVRMHELLRMRLFSKMKMRRDGVLEKMHQQISSQNQKSRMRPAQLNALRNHLDQRRSQPEPRAQRHEIPQIRPLPIPLHNNLAAKNIRARRRQPQQHTSQNGRHEEREYQEAAISRQPSAIRKTSRLRQL